MSNHKSYGKQRSRPGGAPSPWSGLAVCDRPLKTDEDDPYAKMDFLVDMYIAKGYREDDAINRAAAICEKNL